MAHLAITLAPQGAQETCGLCGRYLVSEEGPRLVCADSLAPVCGKCGSEHAPPLAALLQLTRTAERVGGMSRHTLVPPLGALLDLAHAADGFTQALSLRKTSAAPLRAPVGSAAS